MGNLLISSRFYHKHSLSLTLSHLLVFMANERERRILIVHKMILDVHTVWMRESSFIQAYKFVLRPSINSLLSVLRSVVYCSIIKLYMP